MTSYNAVACIVATAVFLFVPRPNLTQSAIASLLLGILWPLTLPVVGYFLLKCYVFKRELATKGWVLDVEIYGCMAVGVAGFVAYLWLTKNPMLGFR